jgi:hypothetical protein
MVGRCRVTPFVEAPWRLGSAPPIRCANDALSGVPLPGAMFDAGVACSPQPESTRDTGVNAFSGIPHPDAVCGTCVEVLCTGPQPESARETGFNLLPDGPQPDVVSDAGVACGPQPESCCPQPESTRDTGVNVFSGIPHPDAVRGTCVEVLCTGPQPESARGAGVKAPPDGPQLGPRRDTELAGRPRLGTARDDGLEAL